MQTKLPAQFLDTTLGKRADSILRSCVHCGFCTATCPTYLLTGNELDSPRGRIYLVKELLEHGKVSQVTRTHLDSCLSCQSCETTCPSDVQYHELLNIGKHIMTEEHAAPWLVRVKRTLLLAVLGSGKTFALLVTLGRMFRFLLPGSLARQLGQKNTNNSSPASREVHERKVVLLGGCVQKALSPNTNQAATRVLNALKIEGTVIQNESCCGAMHFHSDKQNNGLERALQLVAQLETELEIGAEAIVSTASGCGNFIKDYRQLFPDDELMQARLEKLQNKIMDISEFLHNENLALLNITASEKLVFHSPCTLQHGQKLPGLVERLLHELGFKLAPVTDSHLCCGSAGTYSLFQPKMARQLRDNKIKELTRKQTGKIATANIGCQCHLASGTNTPVRHWIEYLADALKGA